MKLRLIVSTALLATAATVPAFAQTYYSAEPAPYAGERIYVPALRSHGAIHGGSVAPADERLLADAMAAFDAERPQNGMTVTIVAKNGELIVNGVASDRAEAMRMEQLARRVSNGHSTSLWTTQTG